MALVRALQKSCLQPAIFHSRLNLPTTICCATSHIDTVGKARKDMRQHWVKNETVARPISPHLTIWKWQLPMNCSLGHRVTGCALTTTLYLFGYGICLLPGDYPYYLSMVRELSLGPALITSAKFVLAYPLVYHYVNGMRHLSWDFGKGLDLKSIYKTGWTAVFGSAVIAALLTQI